MKQRAERNRKLATSKRERESGRGCIVLLGDVLRHCQVRRLQTRKRQKDTRHFQVNAGEIACDYR